MHLNRLDSPKNWKIARKERKWIVRPSPGAHSAKSSIPITLILRDMLHIAETSREVKMILNEKGLLVNNRIVKDHRFAVGLMDTIEIKKFNETYMLLINDKNYLTLFKLKNSKDASRPVKIKNKTHIKGGKVQINLYDGTNILLSDKKQDKYLVGDSLLVDMKENKILKHLKLDKGAFVYLTAGKHVGKMGIVEEMKKNLVFEDTIIVKIGSEKIETLKSYAFVIEEKTLE